MSVSVNAAWNSVVSTAWRNDCSEVAALTDEGRAFHARAAATGKARSPSVERRVDGTISVDVDSKPQVYPQYFTLQTDDAVMGTNFFYF